MQDFTKILNWRRVDGRLTLSGQPTANHFADLAADGVQTIINLAPADNNGALVNEDKIVGDLGMAYTYIPVDFDAPTDNDYDQFCAAMAAAKDSRTHVHCIYNARVTAFMLRYAADGLGGTTEEASAMMETIWRPGAAWARFINDPSCAETANEYAGFDYQPET